MESIFQLIFHDATKHRKIIYFLGIHFSRKSLFKRKLLYCKQTGSNSSLLIIFFCSHFFLFTIFSLLFFFFFPLKISFFSSNLFSLYNFSSHIFFLALSMMTRVFFFLARPPSLPFIIFYTTISESIFFSWFLILSYPFIVFFLALQFLLDYLSTR